MAAFSADCTPAVLGRNQSADTESGSQELCPQMLVLLPEERRLYLVYRGLLPHAPRARLRLESGWCEPGLRPS